MSWPLTLRMSTRSPSAATQGGDELGRGEATLINIVKLSDTKQHCLNLRFICVEAVVKTPTGRKYISPFHLSPEQLSLFLPAMNDPSTFSLIHPVGGVTPGDRNWGNLVDR